MGTPQNHCPQLPLPHLPQLAPPPTLQPRPFITPFRGRALFVFVVRPALSSERDCAGTSVYYLFVFYPAPSSERGFAETFVNYLSSVDFKDLAPAVLGATWTTSSSPTAPW